MQKLSPQTKSFIILFALAVFGTYLCLALWPYSTGSPGEPAAVINYGLPNPPILLMPAIHAGYPAVNTTGWKCYKIKNLHLSFMYGPDWKILPVKTITGFTGFASRPGGEILQH